MPLEVTGIFDAADPVQFNRLVESYFTPRTSAVDPR